MDSAGQFDVLADHNTNWTRVNPSVPTTSTVYLNGKTTLTVSTGTPVTIRSNISDSLKVRGAEYFIDQNPGSDPNLFGKGIPMNASDGIFNAASGALEPI